MNGIQRRMAKYGYIGIDQGGTETRLSLFDAGFRVLDILMKSGPLKPWKSRMWALVRRNLQRGRHQAFLAAVVTFSV
jgi:hypothetical protein